MIRIIEKHRCCGCEACVQRCPKQCISMYEDNEGFLYPEVDTAKCIDCGLCDKVCPELNKLEISKPLKVVGAVAKDKKILSHSSSGGIFSCLAKKILEEGGVVFGAKFDKNWNVVHSYVDNVVDLDNLRRSKYVQSRIGNSFIEAEKFLKEGKKVLFTGTPCQIKALNFFLRKEYENLVTVDIICHGVPSPKIWQKYLSEFKGKRGIVNSNIKEINFRYKDPEWGYDYKLYIEYELNNKKEVYKKLKGEDTYLRAFLANLTLRKSCERCCAKSGKSNSDLTIADFWGIEDINKDFFNPKGVSCVICNSEKSVDLLSKIDIDYFETDISPIQKYNYVYYKNIKLHKRRATYFKKIFKEKYFELYTNKMLRPFFMERVRYMINKYFCKKI